GSGVTTTHSYSTAETFTVVLTVDDGTDTDTDTATVTIEDVPPVPPTADANGPYVGVVNQSLSFDGSESSDSDGSITSYEWSCGDGNSVNGVNPTHSYTSTGTFEITLTVTDDDGLTDNDTTTATIYVGESVDIPEGYLIDTDDDGTVDTFYNSDTGVETTVESVDENTVLIDEDDDGEWDYEYNTETETSTSYETPDETTEEEEFPWLIVALILIIIIIAVIAILIKTGYIYFE
ncbi:MAG: PKD domain-containing protein, partial [Candidatus Thermoplasmatota archaeon]|nr:PKD domain-containing protein [Candidatus Thermoplasmatota archaeon]